MDTFSGTDLENWRMKNTFRPDCIGCMQYDHRVSSIDGKILHKTGIFWGICRCSCHTFKQSEQDQ